MKGIISSDLDLPIVVNLNQPDIAVSQLTEYLERKKNQLINLKPMRYKGITEQQKYIMSTLKNELEKYESILTLRIILDQNFLEEYIPHFIGWITPKIIPLETNLPQNPNNWKIYNSENPIWPPDKYFHTPVQGLEKERKIIAEFFCWPKNAYQLHQIRKLLIHIEFANFSK